MSHAGRSWVLVAGLLAGCTSQEVWQAESEISPISYSVPAETLDRTVGRLRRIAIIPGEFEIRAEWEEVDAAGFRSAFVSAATSFLTVERGYDVQALDPTNLPEGQDAALDGRLESCIQEVVARTKGPDRGSESSADAQTCVKRIGRFLNVDGLLVVGGARVSDRDWRFALTLLTASLAWPTLMAQEKIEASADLFEVSDGQLVWRSHFAKSAAEPTDLWVVVGLLLERLEPALPEVLID